MFKNREDGARQLALKMSSLEFRNPIVLAIPRGGVVTGAILARELNTDLDVVLSRKLRAPFEPEFAIGAVGENGEIYLDDHAAARAGADKAYIERERAHQMEEIARRKELFRRIRPQASLVGRTAILTDDGIATGSTMIAALRVVQSKHPHELIVASPVASPDRLEIIREFCDQVICLAAPEDFQAVGQFYETFQTIEDEHVVRILREFTPHVGKTPKSSREVIQPDTRDF
jgi:putative phosphoribosyl transferase